MKGTQTNPQYENYMDIDLIVLSEDTIKKNNEQLKNMNKKKLNKIKKHPTVQSNKQNESVWTQLKSLFSKSNKSDKKKHPIVGTEQYYYYYAANFDKSFFNFDFQLPWMNQIIRFCQGNIMVLLIVEQFFVGPTEVMVNLGYLNVWSYFFTFLTALYQWKSSNYEVEKAAKKITDPTKNYPNSIWYKMQALKTLELAQAINFVNLIGFFFFLLPNSTNAYDKSNLEEAIGAGWLIQVYFICRNYVVHLIPILCTTSNLFMSDIIFLESDWYLMPLVSFLYLLLNFAISQYFGLRQLYILQWDNTGSTTTEFIPYLVMLGYMTALLSVHFSTAIMTQVWSQRYENDFKVFNNTPT